jgi:F-type H+-transporting ATPase subunit b
MLTNPTFWTGIAFALFFAILFRYKVHVSAAKSLDARAHRIESELNEARTLRVEAENLLREYQAKRNAAEKEAAEILNAARQDAERQAREAQAKTEDFIRRRTAAAEARIAQAENQATADIRAAATEAAIRASEVLLRGHMSDQGGNAYLTQSLSDVKKRLN